jgi:predicted metalloprotease with PDZ domain
MFLRNHFLSKKFFTFLVGSTYLQGKIKSSKFYKDILPIEFTKETELEQENQHEIVEEKDSLMISHNQREFMNTILHILKSITLPINHLLYLLSLYKSKSIMYCDIPKLKKPYLGCSIRANEDGVQGMKILLIKSDSPAERAGLKPKDIILEINGKPVRNINEYNAAVGSEPGIKKMKIFRSDGEKETTSEIDVNFIISE